jgi:YVTN family beta-propeller protein
MKALLFVSATKRNKAQQHVLIVSVIILFSCIILTPFQLHGQSPASNQLSDHYELYKNSEHKIKLPYPSNWTLTETENNINFSSPLEDKSDRFQEGLFIQILPTRNLPLREYASLGIIELKENLENFTLIASNPKFAVSDQRAYKVVYSYLNNKINYEAMKVWVITGLNSYAISYIAELDKFDRYLPLIENMIGLLEVESLKQKESAQNTAGLTLGERPYNIGIDAIKNRIYVTNSRAGTVLVLDGQKDNTLTEIKVGTTPSGIDVDLGTGRIFVTNRDSDTVSVIDGSTNEVINNSISVGSEPLDVAIDPDEKGSKRLIFVSNSGSDTVSVIDGSTNEVIDTIKVGDEPVDLAINTVTNRLYVANYQNNTVSVIDYYVADNEELKNQTVASIQVGDEPTSIDLNSDTNVVYVSNSGSDTVSVIDGSTNEVINNITKVGTSPFSVEVNTEDNLVYVANDLSNTVSVIDGSTNEVINNITVNKFPSSISYNPVSDIAYVVHINENMVSMMNSSGQIVGVTFEIKPVDSGSVNCNGKEFSDGDYFRYNINSPLSCLAVPNKEFSFSSWSGDLTLRPVNASQTIFNASKFGNITANFVIPVEFTFPKEYWDQLTLIILSVIVPAIASWSIPAIASWYRGTKQRKNLEKYMTQIYEINKKSTSQNTAEYFTQIDEIRSSIERALAKGNISESQYEILVNILESFKPKM